MLVLMITYREPPSSKARAHLDFFGNCSSNQAFTSSLSIFSNSFSLASNFFSSLTLHNAFNLAVTFLLRFFCQIFAAKWWEHHMYISRGYPSICSFAPLSKPRWRSEIIQMDLPGPTTSFLTMPRNHDQLSLFSPSTSANARGMSWFFRGYANGNHQCAFVLACQESGINTNYRFTMCEAQKAPEYALQHRIILTFFVW
jgi:hypothetical protein